MNFIIKSLSIIGALVFVIAGFSGMMAPFGDFITHGPILRIVEVLIGAALFYNVARG